MRILFVGCIGISRVMLDALLDDEEDICGIICVPERFQKKTAGYDDLSDIAKKHAIPIFKSRRLHIKKCKKFIEDLEPDIMVVYGWQRIIKKDVLDIPRLASVGFHASLLPAYRGSAPVNWAIINGATITGVTMFQLDEDVDTGSILGQQSFPITLYDTCADVYEKSAKAACELILKHLPDWKKTGLQSHVNISKMFSIMPRRRPEDGIVDWGKTVRQNYNWIRAQTHPYPGAFTDTSMGRIYLWEAKPDLDPTSLKPGDFLIIEKGILFGCKDGTLLVTNYEAVDE